MQQLPAVCIKLAGLTVPVLPAAVPVRGWASPPIPLRTTVASMLCSTRATAGLQAAAGCGC
ncbi:MAG: hypothetical protein Q4Q10_03975, partial [Eubacteriales bacterium]|nr:hypothetical protein [Eubacteriales bacterium]